MTTPTAPTALIAEDEPLLAQALQIELKKAWPELSVLAIAGDGQSAVTQALQHLPDVLFFDIRMPGQNGLDAAAELADEWPEDKPFPALVFITAYDQYAVQAFETQAVDYVLKPVQAARLHKTVKKVQEALAQRASTQAPGDIDAAMDKLRALLGAVNMGAVNSHSAPAQKLSVVQVSVGTNIRMVPID
ncbi:MAG: response regulator, partial [Ramlibacter sp.]|nr:response regulator [Ramlibacter sp.]